jgi:hypothetical protein
MRIKTKRNRGVKENERMGRKEHRIPIPRLTD